MQYVIDLSVNGEPVLAVHLIAPGGEGGEQVFLAAPLLDAEVGHVLAVGLHDLEVAIIHPDAALKIAPVFFDLLGRNVEHVGADLVDALFADVQNLVVRNLIAGQHERHPVLDIVKVLFRHSDAYQRRLRREHHVFLALALVVEQHVFHLLVLAVHRVAVERLHRQRLPVGIVVTRNLELFFFGGEFLDDVLFGDALRRRRVEFALTALGGGAANQVQRKQTKCE